MYRYKNKSLKKSNYPFVAFFIIMLLVHLRIGISVGSDDSYYKAIFEQDNIEKIVSMITLNNRILINVIIAIFLRMNIWIWKIINISLFTMLLVVISKLAKKTLEVNSEENIFWLNFFTCFSIFLIHINVLSSGAYWITGSFNYLWAVTFCFCGIYPIKKEFFEEEYNKKIAIIYTLAAIYACYLEQTAAILTCFGASIIIMILIQKRKVSKYIIIHYLLILINTAILFLLPFNKNRYMGEIAYWYPNYPMLSTMDKLYQGVSHLSNHLVNNTSLIMIILTALIFIILHKKYKDRIIQLVSLIPLIYFLLKVIPFNLITKDIFIEPINLEGTLSMLFYNFDNRLFENIQNIVQYIPVFCSFAIFILIPFLLVAIYDDLNQRIYMILLYLASMASALVISFSPTVFASGNRIFFATDLILILIIRILLNELAKMKLIDSRIFRIITCILFGIASIIVLQTIIQLSGIVYY